MFNREGQHSDKITRSLLVCSLLCNIYVCYRVIGYFEQASQPVRVCEEPRRFRLV